MSLEDRFERDGFAVIEDFFGQSELEQFENAFNALPEFGSIEEKHYVCAKMPEFLRLVSKAWITVTVNRFLGRPQQAPLYCFTNFRIAPHEAGGGQEVFYTTPCPGFVHTWAPLIRNSTVANGTIEVCPGSHKTGIAAWTAIPMRIGQMMFFDGRLFHRNGLNTSKEIRYSMVGTYQVARPQEPT